MTLITNDQDRVKRIKELGMNRPIDYIRAESVEGIDVDYISGYDSGEGEKETVRELD